MESNTNNVASFQKQAPVSFNQSLNMFFTQNLRLLGYQVQHLYEDEDPFYNPQLSVNPIKWKFTKSRRSSAVFVNENTLNIEQSRFVKPIN
jgi:hypothetical protein